MHEGVAPASFAHVEVFAAPGSCRLYLGDLTRYCAPVLTCSKTLFNVHLFHMINKPCLANKAKYGYSGLAFGIVFLCRVLFVKCSIVLYVRFQETAVQPALSVGFLHVLRRSGSEHIALSICFTLYACLIAVFVDCKPSNVLFRFRTVVVSSGMRY